MKANFLEKSPSPHSYLDKHGGKEVTSIFDMTWAVLEYSIQEVNRAGEALVRYAQTPDSDPNFHYISTEYDAALRVINNWRSCHSRPLQTFYVGLRQRTERIYPKYIAARRIKRLSSIQRKLVDEPLMKLSQMQDIGGCRSIVNSVGQVRKLEKAYRNSRIKHKDRKIKDYIEAPKPSGYRGIHLIYRYYSDRDPTWNDRKIEIQLRSKLQHVWATAVETYGTLTKQPLKANKGEKEWLRFFSLVGGAFALREKCALVPYTPTNRSTLIKEMKGLAKRLNVETTLKMFGQVVDTIERPHLRGAEYFLLMLNPSDKSVSIVPYKGRQLPEATRKYLEVERFLKPGSDAVLVSVSVESIAALKQAFPNYFLDTKFFLDALALELNS